MAACVALSISSAGGLGNAEDAKPVTETFESFARPALQNAVGEDLLQACMTVAVDMSAGGVHSCPAAPILSPIVMNGSESKFTAQNAVSKTEIEGKIDAADLDVSSNVDDHHVNPAPEIDVSSTEAPSIGLVLANDVDNIAAMIFHSFSFTGLNHVAFCVKNLERSLDFYSGLLGLKTNMDRPELPYRGAWLFLGTEGIHLMEVPNPDPVNGRPAHGGFDRHACLNCRNVEGVGLTLEKAGIPYQRSIVPSIFTRDPDGNGLEFIEVDS